MSARYKILVALLAANGGKMLVKEARQKMHLSRPVLMASCFMDGGIELGLYHLDKRQKILILR